MKKIIINRNPWQTRIAITQDNKLQNVYFERHGTPILERTFFRGTITKVLPGIQTAFVAIGQERDGFLHISEIDHDLALDRISKTTQLDEDEESRKKTRRSTKKLDIKNIFKQGDPVLIQVSKEPIYEKGAKLTTCFTLPGRFVVLMPNIPRIAISKKIADRQERYRLKDIVRSALPEGMGAIIRTTSDGREAKHLIKDIKFLVNTWQTIQKKFKSAESTDKLYEDLELSFQIVRDYLDDDVESVVVDDKSFQGKVSNFIKAIAPEHSRKVSLYDGKINIFDHFNITPQIEAALQKRVMLQSGGSLIIESTEAMTVIDVNTGRFTGKSNMEETILETNLQAARETVRQLRLRNIGGLIVIDFIDMATPANRQKLFNVFEKTLRERDKFQSVVLKVSEFGLVQMTRKRSGKTLMQQLTETCPRCKSLGVIKSLPTECYAILRQLKRDILSSRTSRPIKLIIGSEMFDYITSTEYNAVLELEKMCKCKIEISSNPHFDYGEYKIEKK